MKRKTSDFPTLKVDEAITLIEKLERELKGNASNRDAFAKLCGYKSANNGAFINLVSDLRKYGLLEKRGDIQITELGRKIVYAKGGQKNQFLSQALKNVPLFSRLIDNIGTKIDEVNLQSQLLNAGFSQVDAIKDEKKIAKIYKTFLPYITNIETKENNLDNEYDNIRSGIVPEKAELSQNTDILFNSQIPVYRANLASDGISLIVPVDKDKIGLVRILLDRLEKRIDEEKKKVSTTSNTIAK